MFDCPQCDAIVSMGVSIGTAIGVAAFFRYKVKPKIESVFEENRLSNYDFLFNGIEDFDFIVERFYFILERDFGPVTEARENMFTVPSLTNYSSIDTSSISAVFTPSTYFKQIEQSELKKIYDDLEHSYHKFKEGINSYQLYIEVKLLHNVSLYYWITLYWMKYILTGYNMPTYWKKRPKYASSIIDFVEKDSQIRNIRSVGDFITKWMVLLT